MEPFEDENPFDTGTDRLHSEASSTIAVDDSEPASPPVDGFRTGSPTPTSPQPSRPPFPSPGSHRLPQPYKSEHCCARDQWLHSGEDVEILVRPRAAAALTWNTQLCVADRRRPEDVCGLHLAIHHVYHQGGGTYEHNCTRRGLLIYPADCDFLPQVLGV